MSDYVVPFLFTPGAGVATFRVTPSIEWKFLIFPKIRIRIDWGLSLCSPEDRYNEEFGADLAAERMQDHIEGSNQFSKRSLAGRFFVKWKDWNQICTERKEAEFCMGVLVNNSLIRKPWSWDRYVN